MIKSFLKNILPKNILELIVKTKSNVNRRVAMQAEENRPEFIKRKNFYAQFLRKGDTYFDIGANYGNRISPIIKLEVGLIIAVEPQEACCIYLKETFKGITVLQNGVGAVAETKTFYVSSDSVLSSFSQDFIDKTGDTRFVGNTWNETKQIEIITLDSIIEKYGTPDFVKVDVEGFEPEVFKGLSKPLKVVSFEYTVPELSDNLFPVIEKLNSLGNCTFNYSIGESMELHLKVWVSFESIKNILETSSFIATGFGDVYVKYN